GAAAQVFVAEACAQQRPGVVGHAAQPGGVGLLALVGGGGFAAFGRAVLVVRFAAGTTRGAGVESTLHGFALGVIGGLLAGPGIGVAVVVRRRWRSGIRVGIPGRLRPWRGRVTLLLFACVVIRRGASVIAAVTGLVARAPVALATIGRHVAAAGAAARRLAVHHGFDSGAVGHRVGHVGGFAQSLVVSGDRLFVAARAGQGIAAVVGGVGAWQVGEAARRGREVAFAIGGLGFDAACVCGLVRTAPCIGHRRPGAGCEG